MIVLILWQLIAVFVMATDAYAASDPAKIQDIVPLLERVIKLLAPFAVVTILWIVILAAFKFMRAGNDPKKVEDAKAKLTYALVGALLIAGSWFVLQAIATLTGVNDITKVELPQ